MACPTLFTTYLKMLGVPHTATYSNQQYKSYPPKLGFVAFQDLLYEYRVKREVTKAPHPDAQSLESLRTPFVTRMADGSPRIVTAVSVDRISYITPHGNASAPAADFLKSWSGEALTAAVTPDSAEPDWRKHCFHHAALVAERYAFWILLAALCAFFFVSNRIYASWSMTLLTACYIGGTVVSWLLTLKQNNVNSQSAEAICSMIQPHGCNTVINSDQGMFLGLFHWSEIGLTFFTVSLGALLLHPATCNYLAYISILCLPYTVWSVYTQHWRLHSWCTLCLCVQALFWIIFGLQLGGGHMHALFPLRWDLAVLLACYGVVLLLLHKIVAAYFVYERSQAPADPLSSSSVTPLK